MNKINLLCMNVVFFCDIKGLRINYSIVITIKLSKIFAGAEPPCKISGGFDPLSPPYSTPLHSNDL